MNKENVMQALSCKMDNNLNANWTNGTLQNPISTSGWSYWQDYYYPYVIRESYPVYFQERAIDKGKKAFEIVKILKDKKLVNLEKVSDFIDLMDSLIQIL